MNPTLFYRKAATEGASGFGLLVGLFDTLAGDLRRAAEAQRARDIEKRCKEGNHALLVIGHLEDWVNHGEAEIGPATHRLLCVVAAKACLCTSGEQA